MDWQTWFVGVSAVATVVAAGVALRAHRWAAGYQDAFWVFEGTHRLGELEDREETVLALRNVGRTDARDVKVSLPFDPTELHASASGDMSRVAPGGSVLVRFGSVRPVVFNHTFAFSGKPERSYAAVRWRSVSGGRRRQRVALPADPVAPEDR